MQRAPESSAGARCDSQTSLTTTRCVLASRMTTATKIVGQRRLIAAAERLSSTTSQGSFLDAGQGASAPRIDDRFRHARNDAARFCFGDPAVVLRTGIGRPPAKSDRVIHPAAPD